MLNADKQPEVSSGLPLGMIIPSAVAQTDAGLHLLDGTQLSKTGVYAQFCTWLTAKYNADSTSVPTCTETQWQNEVSATGQCGKFVITSTTVRLPKITQFIEGLNSLSDLAKREDAGVPDIEGYFHSHWTGTDVTGPFSNETGSSSTTILGGSSRNSDIVRFKASKANPAIYGNSTTVQPQSVRYPYYIVIATLLKTQIQVDLDQYVADLNLKVDKTTRCRTMVPSARRTDGIYNFNITGGQTYTAPADGYVYVYFVPSGSLPNDLYLANNTVGIEVSFVRRNNTGAYIPCKKGDNITFYASGTGNTSYCVSRFIYAETLEPGT